MKTIIYKKRGDAYECVAIRESDDKLSAILLDEPCDGKIKIGKHLYETKNGVCRFDLSEIENGEYSPALIKNRRLYKMEEIIVRDGGVQKKTLGEDYLRALSSRIEENHRKIFAMEKKLTELSEKIENKITL